MKVVSVSDLVERLKNFYDYNDFISFLELNVIFDDCIYCDGTWSDNSIEIGKKIKY